MKSHTTYLTFRTQKRKEIVPITIDFGPWQRIFYVEFDGQRNKRVIVKVIGE